MSEPTRTQDELHAEALAEGYKDEECPKCHTMFLAHKHFILCPETDCPMKDGKGTVLEQLFESLEQAAKEQP